MSHVVSIHALLAECDLPLRRGGNDYGSFNPRTPCGVRLLSASGMFMNIWFQSTHSLRSATIFFAVRTLYDPFQSTHSLRSATGELGTDDPNPTVSIHALLAECDGIIADCTVLAVQFQSTHSLRSATFYEGAGRYAYIVSIHALLAECDNHQRGQPPDNKSFNPRTPCGVRRKTVSPIFDY